MKLKLICIGRLREAYFRQAAEEYVKRLSRFHKIEIIEIPEALKMDSPSATDIYRALHTEGDKILKACGKGAFVTSLAIEGEHASSEDVAHHLFDLSTSGVSEADFIIGGSHGLSEDVLNFSDRLLSFSRMTFTYQLSRVILLEQLYRASKINAGETYHK